VLSFRRASPVERRCIHREAKTACRRSSFRSRSRLWSRRVPARWPPLLDRRLWRGTSLLYVGGASPGASLPCESCESRRRRLRSPPSGREAVGVPFAPDRDVLRDLPVVGDGPGRGSLPAGTSLDASRAVASHTHRVSILEWCALVRLHPIAGRSRFPVNLLGSRSDSISRAAPGGVPLCSGREN